MQKTRKQQKTARRPFFNGGDKRLLLAAAIQLEDVLAFAHRQQAGVGVDALFGASVGDVEVAHGQQADPIRP